MSEPAPTPKRRPLRTLLGDAEMSSALFSNEWRLHYGGQVVARAIRRPRHRYTGVLLEDGTQWILQPDGWGVVRAVEAGVPFARATRQSFWGRRWEIGGVSFHYVLTPDGPLPRRWALRVGGEPAVLLRGASLTYNRVRVYAPVSVPLVAVILAWHVVARPWEAAAFAPRLISGETEVRPYAETA